MADALTRPTIRRVATAATEVMAEALGQCGTSLDALYVQVNGASRDRSCINRLRRSRMQSKPVRRRR